MRQIPRVEEPGGVVDHVHALVDIALVGDVGVDPLHREDVGAVFDAQRHGVILRFIEGRANDRAVVSAPIVVGFVPGAGIPQADVLRCGFGVRSGADAIAVAPVECRQASRRSHAVANVGKARRQGFDDDRAAEAVAAFADGRHARDDVGDRDLRRVDVRQRRVHVVGAGRCHGHAVDQNLDAVVVQSVDRGQARNAARLEDADAWSFGQKLGGIARPGKLRLNGLAGNASRAERHREAACAGACVKFRSCVRLLVRCVLRLVRH